MGILKVISSSNMHNPQKEKPLSVGKFSEEKFSFNVNQRLVINISEGYRIIKFCAIRSLRSDSNYTILSLINGESLLVPKTLKYFENQLDNNFLRVHNSYIINLLNIKLYNKSECEIILDDNTSVPVARRKKSIVELYFIGN